MKTSLMIWFSGLLLLLACSQETPPVVTPVDNQPALTVAEELAQKHYRITRQVDLYESDKKLVELTDSVNLLVSGPDSRYGTATPCLKLAISFDQSNTRQDYLLELAARPLYLGQFAFYFADNRLVDNKDFGSLEIYRR